MFLLLHDIAQSNLNEINQNSNSNSNNMFRIVLAMVLGVASVRGFVPHPKATMVHATSPLNSSIPGGAADNPEPIIYNCHIHLCHLDHIPSRFPNRVIRSMANIKFLRKAVEAALRLAVPWSDDDNLERMADFIKHGGMDETKLFEVVEGHYPKAAPDHPPTHFVALPMDLRGLYKGDPPEDIETQHRNLAKLAKLTDGRIIPFVHIDPRSGSPDMPGPIATEFIKQCTTPPGLEDVVFRGIKLYPPLGYNPDDGPDGPVDKIFQYANENRLPVMVHCSQGGMITNSVKGLEHLNKKELRRRLMQYTSPSSYKNVLKKYPDMRLCLAHFGGNQQWDAYEHDDNGSAEDAPDNNNNNWVSTIADMMKSGNYTNLYTDVSYTMFRYPEYIEDLVALLEDNNIQSHVLFGSDYYMAEQEKMKEKELSKGLRKKLTEPVWWKIAHTNPKKFLDI